MTASIILDVLVVALLIPTIVFAVLLNNRLAMLRRNRDDLARLVAAFNEATCRAEGGIPKLRKASEDAGQTLQEKIERTQMLRDDLAFMIERASAMADRLEDAVRVARDHIVQNGGYMPPEALDAPLAPLPSPPGAARDVGPTGVPLAVMDIESAAAAAAAAERAAARALQSAAAAPTPPLTARRPDEESAPIPPSAAAPSAKPPSEKKSIQSRPTRAPSQPLGAALTAGGMAPVSALGGGETALTPSDERSEAERELLRALKSAR